MEKITVEKTSQELIKAAKLRVRKTKEDALDDDIKQLVEAALCDLRRIGVSDKYLTGCTDPLLREAVLTYVNANYGSNPNYEKLISSYNMHLIKITGGNYRE